MAANPGRWRWRSPSTSGCPREVAGAVCLSGVLTTCGTGYHLHSGGHRRYSRRQLEFRVRVRALFDQGHTLTATVRILELEDALAAANVRIAELTAELNRS